MNPWELTVLALLAASACLAVVGALQIVRHRRDH